LIEIYFELLIISKFFDLFINGEYAMTVKTPRHFGLWRGQVILAIVGGAQTWGEIRKGSGLHPGQLNKALAELYEEGTISRRGGRYQIIDHRLLDEYKGLVRGIESSLKEYLNSEGKFSSKGQEELVKWIAQWREFKRLNFSLVHKHFFLAGRYLDDFSKDLISYAKSKALVVAPFVYSCHLSETMREASKRGVKVRLITRPPRKQYHESLKRDNVIIRYDENVHAKIIVVDHEVAIVSSMNFFTDSSGGKSWEAGLVSIENNVAISVVKSILNYLKDRQTS